MKFPKIKTLFFFWVIMLIGGWISNWVTNALGLSPGTDMLTTLLLSFIPAAIVYWLWINFGKTRAE